MQALSWRRTIFAPLKARIWLQRFRHRVYAVGRTSGSNDHLNARSCRRITASLVFSVTFLAELVAVPSTSKTSSLYSIDVYRPVLM